MKAKKLLTVLLSSVMVFALAAGCGQTNSDASGTAAAGESQAGTSAADTSPAQGSSAGNTDGKKASVAVIFKTLSAEYWKTMEAGSKKAAEELGIDVTVLGPNAESEIAQQVTQIEEQLSSGVDAICVAPCEENAVIGALSPAIGQIPVILVDTDANLKGKTAFIGTGNENAAKLGGEFAAKAIGAGGKAVLIGGQQGEVTSAQRLAGFRAGLEENGAVVLEEQFGNNTADKALAVMEDLLTKYPGEIQAVLAMNDDMAIGVQQACENAGISDILIVGFNADAGAVELVEQGKLAATIAQQPYLMGYQCVQEAYKAIQGETIEAHQDVAAELVTSDNVAAFKEKAAALK